VFHGRAPALPAQSVPGGGLGGGRRGPLRPNSTPRVRPSGSALQLDPSRRSSPALPLPDAKADHRLGVRFHRRPCRPHPLRGGAYAPWGVMHGGPVLSILTWAPFVGAVLIMFPARHRPLLVRAIAVASTGLALVVALVIYLAYDREAAGFQFYEEIQLVPPLG